MDGKKRAHEQSVERESPEVKRLRDDLVRSLFDDNYDYDHDNVEFCQALESLMKSFEEEIRGPTPATVKSGSDELGFLLEASDEELGLPPPPPMSFTFPTELDRVEPGLFGFGDAEDFNGGFFAVGGF